MRGGVGGGEAGRCCRGSRQWGPWRKGLDALLFARLSVSDQRVEITLWSYEEEEGQRDAVPMVFISEDKL